MRRPGTAGRLPGLRGAGVLVLALLAGCARPVPVPRAVPVLGEEARIQGWLARARAEARARHGVRAVGSLRVDSPEGSARVKQVILAQRPDRLRLESLGPLGQTRRLWVTDGESFWFYDGRRLETGAVTPGVLARHAGLDLEPPEAVRLMLAAPLSGEPGPAGPLRILGRGEERIVELPGRRLRFAGSGEIRGVEALDPGGGARWSAEYTAWRVLPEGRYPFEMRLRFPLTGLRARLDLEHVELNPVLDPSLFRVDPEDRP